ncbi:major facilitator superfamily transport protein [Natronomonas moolapensis 8.8.11]|uniref:Major facilitator superfamily transport protein n=2 Tax=Halobacteriales TaxID=2235 RepID=M1XN18_NATM8|nr:MFS transporter [Natronomonas moolapensis]CCQ35297.1 major facilitator superfamily transport protein [Natronomonas moolapensis 8.8.11]
MSRAERARLSAVVFVVLFTQLLVYPGVDRLVDALGGAPTIDAGTAFLAVQLGAFVLFSAVWGALSDRVGCRVPFVVAGAVGGTAAYLALAALVVTDLGDFRVALALRFLEGAFTIGAFSLSITMLMDLDGGHGKNMGAAGIAIGGGAAIGAPVGGQLYAFGPLAPILFAAALLSAVAVAVSTLPDRAAGQRQDVAAAFDGLRGRTGLLVPFAFGFADRFAAGFFGLVGTFYFRDAFGLDPAAIGLLLACFFVPFALLQYLFGALSDRIGRVLPIAAGSVGFGAAILGVGLAPTVPVAALAMVAVGVLGALVAPATMALVTDLVDADQRGAAMGGFNIFGSLGFLGGILVGGWLATRYGYLAAFAVAGGLEIAIATLTLPVLFRIVPRPSGAETARE